MLLDLFNQWAFKFISETYLQTAYNIIQIYNLFQQCLFVVIFYLDFHKWSVESGLADEGVLIE